MKAWLRRVAGWITVPAGLTGGCLGAAVVGAQPGATGLPGLLFGWLYGVVVGGAMRLFPVPPPAFPLVGLLAGPLPIALLMPTSADASARGLLWLGAVAGLVIGLVEWACARRARAAAGARDLGGGDPGS